MAAIDINSLSTWITTAALDHPQALAEHVAERLGISRATARRALNRLAAAQWLQREGSTRRPRWQPGLLRQVVQRYALAGLDEATPWQRDFATRFTLPPAVQRMVQHAFGELLNNAIEHSEGTSVTVSLRQTPNHVQLLVSDDGRGVFDKIGEAFALPDPASAMFALSQGKLSSAPERHSGRGLYFSSRMADVFDLHANAAAFQRRAWEAQHAGSGWRAGRPLPRRGSSVYFAVSLDTPRTLDAVLRQSSLDGCGLRFETTQVPLRLLTSAHTALDSRAQARRVAARLADFARAELDFSGVPHVGHGFADELFRVIGAQQPGLAMVPVNMSAAVAEMVATLR